MTNTAEPITQPNPTLDLLKAHRSIRAFKPEPVPEADIHTAVAAGQMASTSSAVQAYCAIRITDQAKREQIADLCGPQPKVAQCGCFMVICADTRKHRLCAHRDGHPYQAKLEAFLVGAIDASLFAEKMVIAFESMGYGICYIGGLRNHLDQIVELLDIPEGVYPLYGLCIGVPDESPSMRPRLAVESVLYNDRYPADEEVADQLAEYDTRYEQYLKDRGANPTTWSTIMGAKYTEARRVNLASVYQSLGADLS